MAHMQIETTPSTIIVVGAGNAALCAALAAYEEGADVIMLEAAPHSDRGGNSRYSGAVFRGCHEGLDSLKPLLCDEGLMDIDKVTMAPYTTLDYAKDLVKVTQGRCDMEQVNCLTKNSNDTLKWMVGHGCKFTLALGKYMDYAGANAGPLTKFSLSPGSPLVSYRDGVGLVDDLFKAVENSSIRVYYDTPGHDLLMRGDTCYGVRVRHQDKFLDLEGKVILACGGFEANPRLRRQYLGEGWELVAVRGTMRNQGAMLEKALAAGAQAIGDWGHAHSSPQDIDAPMKSDLAGTRLMHRYSYPYSRFMDEGEDLFSHTYAKTGSRIRAQPQARAYQVFDQKVTSILDNRRYSRARKYESNTLEGLAEQLGIASPEVFAQEIMDFNTACQPGNFDAAKLDGLKTQGLSTPKSNWAQPIDSPPYVAYAVTAGITFTYGGLKADLDGRVYSNEDHIMPGLYAAGEMTGGLFWFNYSGGAGLMKGAVFGRLAGKAAAQEAAGTRKVNGLHNETRDEDVEAARAAAGNGSNDKEAVKGSNGIGLVAPDGVTA